MGTNAWVNVRTLTGGSVAATGETFSTTASEYTHLGNRAKGAIEVSIRTGGTTTGGPTAIVFRLSRYDPTKAVAGCAGAELYDVIGTMTCEVDSNATTPARAIFSDVWGEFFRVAVDSITGGAAPTVTAFEADARPLA